ncbi:hypothetical protein C7N43_29215 [Sphingobacteriales bacterium UPWRP_1]|nr:hypothetical protein B6N25_17015 [Sphingobacteriales bacterium TSM_CSS]PSJ73412.1 hypothetical protein C7N43_29215 [Sphingobacteriales bacterium UPWRP_1]
MPLLTVHKIICFRTNDLDHADELRCRIIADDAMPREFKHTILAGQQWNLNTDVLFASFVRIQLWEDSAATGQPFYAGQTDVAAAVCANGSFEAEFLHQNGWYRIYYSLDIQPPVTERNIQHPVYTTNDNPAMLPEMQTTNRGLPQDMATGSGDQTGRVASGAGKGFLPSIHGFAFPNYFTFQLNTRLSFIPRFSSTYGLCGGMVKAAADYYEHQLPLPHTNIIPQPGSSLYRYLVKRQMQSFGPTFAYLTRFFKWWMLYSTLKTQQLTLHEWEKIKIALDNQILVQLGVVYVDHHQGSLWENHQVLAYAYEQPNPGLIYLKIYDPNFPKRDDVFIKGEFNNVQTDKKSISRLICEQHIPGWVVKPVRGFFEMPVKSKHPKG